MRFLKLLSLLLVILLVTFFSIGLLKPSINYSFTIDIQAPISKAYNAMASHEMKPQLYGEIDASEEKTRISPFEVGSTSFMSYVKNGKAQSLKEQVVELDSLKYIELLSETKESIYESKIYFTDKQLISRLRITEIMQGRSFMERSFLICMKPFIKRNREAFFMRKKQIIESTPDYNYRYEERK